MARSTTIAARLFTLVFGFSVAWFTLATGAQLALEYQNTRLEVDTNLEDLYSATRASFESSLWNYDLPLVRESLASTRSVRFLSGASVQDESGAVLASWGYRPELVPASKPHNVDVWAAPLYHVFPLKYLDQENRTRSVGDLVLVSGLDILGLRLADRFRLIVSNYAASTLGLMVILILGLRGLVALPLGRITEAIDAYRFDRASLPPLGHQPRKPDELSVLWKSFEALTANLRESWLQQRVMSAILEEAAVMALVCDADGRIVSSNAQARVRLAGGQPGGALEELAYGDQLGPLLPEAPAILRQGKAWRAEVSASGDLGQTYWLSAALLPLEVADEPRARWGVMIEDISVRKLAEHYRLERDRAQESTRAKSLFLANLSHEIRTPMNAVVGLTALALNEDLAPRVRGYLGPLERSAKVLLGIINDILDFSKLEEGKVELEVMDFRIDTLLEDVEAIARFRAEEKGLVFTVHHPPATSLVLRGDPLRLQQILMNLASNAVKFTEKGSISLSAFPCGAQRGVAVWRFEVRDTGIGISPADQDRLFDSFTQLDSSTTRIYGGTGLGLSIVRQLVNLMGGRLGVESTPGQGSLFWFELELASGNPVPEKPRPAWTGLKGLRVLLAEDNKVNQLVAREILAQMGIVPVVVNDGSQAVETVRKETFDLVLMDLQMPVMDGLEAARKIREVRGASELPILAMTAHTFAQERATCLAAGMQDVVPKPVDPDVLFATLSRWRPGATST